MPNEKQLIDIAFHRAEKEARKESNIKYRELTRIAVASKEIEEKLIKAINSIPEIKELHPFYKNLVFAIIDKNKLLKSIAHFNVSKKIIIKLKKKLLIEAKKDKETAIKKRKEFYGRINSIVKKLKESIKEYNEAQKKLVELPNINVNEFSIILTGYPNTGKTTLLKRLTKSKAEIAAYPFTTKKLNIGKLKQKYTEIQVIDTPGLLDRPLEKRNNIEKKAILALQYLKGIIVFVVDPLEETTKIETQKKLLNEIKENFKEKSIIIVINKADIATKEQIDKALKEFNNAVIDSNTLNAENLKKELEKFLKK